MKNGRKLDLFFLRFESTWKFKIFCDYSFLKIKARLMGFRIEKLKIKCDIYFIYEDPEKLSLILGIYLVDKFSCRP